MAAYGIDATIFGRRYLPALVNNVLPATKILSEISYYSNLAGLVLLVPAVITGFHEWWEIAKYRGENKFVDGVVRHPLSFFLCHIGLISLPSSYRKFNRTLTEYSRSLPFTAY
ncbi:hypothetical protein QFC19_001400 [Naganishia cerealis]|uniref:Uncharacterized protein n=1 Tax=Naganishia cerealis TaxID=610337 RepID=A0ACC2WJ93_9TREE|nr:hypothetical protein QFC19_001400 [Naganishia cerealis]